METRVLPLFIHANMSLLQDVNATVDIGLITFRSRRGSLSLHTETATGSAAVRCYVHFGNWLFDLHAEQTRLSSVNRGIRVTGRRRNLINTVTARS